MKSDHDIKSMVREKYGEIAIQQGESLNSCCGAENCCGEDIADFSESYSDLSGYVEAADMGLGCGLPTQYATIQPGDTVLDLGCGAGNDVFVARSITGVEGKVIGVDMTPEMIDKARSNAAKLGYENVDFRLGEIEALPVAGSSVDVVISNCVLNLVPDKAKAFAEIFRVLKPGGRFSISDIVLEGELPEEMQSAAALYAGCVAGALQQKIYLGLIEANGFENIRIMKSQAITLPDEIVNRYLDDTQLRNFRESGTGIYSITVSAEKPESQCCEPGCC